MSVAHVAYVPAFSQPYELWEYFSNNLPMPTDVQRTLGELRGEVSAISASILRLIQVQDRARVEEAESRRRLYERLEAHVEDDSDSLQKIEGSITRLHERLVKMEASNDMLESHAEALADLEKRVGEQEIAATVSDEVAAKKRKWAYGFLSLLGILEGDHVTGSKILKGIASLFH